MLYTAIQNPFSIFSISLIISKKDRALEKRIVAYEATSNLKAMKPAHKQYTLRQLTTTHMNYSINKSIETEIEIKKYLHQFSAVTRFSLIHFISVIVFRVCENVESGLFAKKVSIIPDIFPV